MNGKRKLTKPTAREDRQINAAIARDPDTYELSASEFKELRPVLRGRPKAVVCKLHVNVRLDAQVVDFFKRGGRGWQTRLNAALLAHVKRVTAR